MLKWCALTRDRAMIKGNQTGEYTYKPQDMDFRKEVDAVALQCFQKGVFENLGEISSTSDYLMENRQLKTWVKNIEIIVKKTKGAKLGTVNGY